MDVRRGGPVCSMCGLRPARAITIHRHVGMLILQKFVRIRTPLCRDHGAKVANDFLKKTLVQGWWGIISFFVNFYCVFADMIAIGNFKSLGAPGSVPTPDGMQLVQGTYTYAGGECQLGIDRTDLKLFVLPWTGTDITLGPGDVTSSNYRPGALELGTRSGPLILLEGKKSPSLNPVNGFAQTLMKWESPRTTTAKEAAKRPRRPVRPGSFHCPNEHPIPDGARFCGTCGSELVTTA
jgi:hypothetical protein